MMVSRRTHNFYHGRQMVAHRKNDKARSLNDQALLRAKEGQRLRGYSHAAGLFAAAAGFSALLAVLHVGPVLLALVAAGFADFRALAQQVLSVLRAAGHKAGRQGADIGAVAVEADAAGHHLDFLLAQAGGSAVFASIDAGIESGEQALILRMHGTVKLGGNDWLVVYSDRQVLFGTIARYLLHN